MSIKTFRDSRPARLMAAVAAVAMLSTAAIAPAPAAAADIKLSPAEDAQANTLANAILVAIDGASGKSSAEIQLAIEGAIAASGASPAVASIALKRAKAAKRSGGKWSDDLDRAFAGVERGVDLALAATGGTGATGGAGGPSFIPPPPVTSGTGRGICTHNC